MFFAIMIIHRNVGFYVSLIFLVSCISKSFLISPSITKKNLRIAEFFASLPYSFLTYISHKRLKPSKHFVQL